MNKKARPYLALLCFAIFAAAVPFWAFPQIEKDLDRQAAMAGKFSVLENAEMEWNGRSGYLHVPADIDKDMAQAAAEEIEQIQGVRSVKIIYDVSTVPEGETPVIEPTPTPVPTEQPPAQKEPGSFKMEWTQEDKSIDGKIDDESADAVEDIFGVRFKDTDEQFALSDTVLEKLQSIGGDLFDYVAQGVLEVDGERITISGTMADTADADTLSDNWGGIDQVELDLQAAPVQDFSTQAQEEINAVLADEGIYFHFSESRVPTKSQEAVDKIAQILLKYEKVHVDIIGHTDSYGWASSNQTLSEKRARAVYTMLVAQGVDASRISISGAGETQPVDSNDTEKDRAVNRRVEITVRGND